MWCCFTGGGCINRKQRAVEPFASCKDLMTTTSVKPEIKSLFPFAPDMLAYLDSDPLIFSITSSGTVKNQSEGM